jgi:hypothetical protein
MRHRVEPLVGTGKFIKFGVVNLMNLPQPRTPLDATQ